MRKVPILAMVAATLAGILDNRRDDGYLRRFERWYVGQADSLLDFLMRHTDERNARD